MRSPPAESRPIAGCMLLVTTPLRRVQLVHHVFGCTDLSLAHRTPSVRGDHIGCYKDSYDRDLPVQGPISVNSMTIFWCVDYCMNLGYKYAGLQFGEECWCGNSYGKHGPSSDCNKKCKGDNSFLSYLYCGGPWANDVHSTGATGTVSSGCPTIITRAQWGARAPIGGPWPMANPVSYVAIHHGASATCTTMDSCKSMMRQYQNLHMDTNGWPDIGYSFVVGEDGNVYEARGWSQIGAHAPAYNSNSIGICVIGNFMTRLPNTAALDAVKRLISCGVSLGKIKSDYILRGHRDGSATSCPGDSFYAHIRTWPRYV